MLPRMAAGARFPRAWIATILAALSSVALAAPVAFPTATSTVRLDGVPLGAPLHPASLNSLRFTVAYSATDGVFHLWVLNGGDTQDPADMQVSDITHATSTDGIEFTSHGKLAPPASWWTQIAGVGATSEPSVNYLRADRIGANWYLTIWSPNETGTGRYNYNANVWFLGPDPGNLAIVQRGPLPSLSDAPVGPGGNMVGSFGMVGGAIYLRQDTQFDSGPPIAPPSWGGGMGRYVYTDATRPKLSGVWGTSEADLFAGTPYCWGLPASPPNACTTFPTRTTAYVHNSGRAIAQGSSTGAYYTFRDWTTGARLAKQIYYVESADGGATWSTPAGVYANGNAVLVDGLPNTAAFSAPEVTATASGYRSYLSTADACGRLVVVTDEASAAPKGPAISKHFGATTVVPGGVTTLTVDLAAPAATCTPAPTDAVFTHAGFTDVLPAGVVLGSPALVSNTCGGTVTAAAGAGTFGLAGAGLAPGASCSVTVNVVAIAAGSQANTIPRAGGTATSAGFFNDQSAAAVASANATLVVEALPTTPANVPVLDREWLALLAIAMAALGALRMRRER